MEISLPLDSDGFLRRECPSCEHEFKWHNGPANEEAEQHEGTWDTMFCPLCGQPAGPESWYTQPQLDLIEGYQDILIAEQLGAAFKDLERSTRRNKHVKFKASRTSVPGTPEALTEPDDMMVVTSPCHAWEPVKVPEDHVGPLHCLVCGSAYAV